MRENKMDPTLSWFCKINHSTIKRCGSGAGGKVPNWTGASFLRDYLTSELSGARVAWSEVDSEMTNVAPDLRDWNTWGDALADVLRVLRAGKSLADKGISVGDVLYAGPFTYEHITIIVYWGPLLLTWEQIRNNNQFSDSQTPANPVPYIVDHGSQGKEGGSDYAGPKPFYALWWTLPTDLSVGRITAQYPPIANDAVFIHTPSSVCIPADEAMASPVSRDNMMSG